MSLYLEDTFRKTRIYMWRIPGQGNSDDKELNGRAGGVQLTSETADWD